MPSKVIEVNNLSKSFVIAHEGREKYSTLRDTVAKKAKKIFSFPKSFQSAPVTKETFWALKDVSFEINQGDRVGIIGRNGAGKSTLLKILSRITEPTTGQIKIRGRVASLLEVGTGFHPELTGRENIFLNGAILGMSRAEIKKHFDAIVNFAGIEKFLDTPVKRYSSGMYVRLAFAVAAHLEPEILIVDEVLAVGDAEFQKKCLGKMEEISKNDGRTLLFVSHQLGMIQSLCNSCILMSRGEIEIKGAASAVINHYLNETLAVPASMHNNIRIDADESRYAQLLSIKLVDEEGRIKNEFDVFEKKYIEAEVIIRKDQLSFILFYYLKRGEETVICSHENDLDPKRLDKRNKGIYNYRVSIPTCLKAGVYKFDAIGIGVPNVDAIHTLENLIEFQLFEYSFDASLSGYSANRPGFILADSVYNIEVKSLTEA